jgi:hypothetical protein
MHGIDLSPDGTVLSPPLYDGLVRGLLLCKDKRLLLPVETSDGRQYCLVMHAVDRLRVDDFREGNTILSIDVSRGEQLTVEDVAFAFDVDIDQSAFLRRTMDRLRNEGLILVRISPSYGAAVVCVCSEMSLEADLLPG